MSNVKDLQVNEEIKDRELRIVDVNGEQLGIMSARQALDLAAEKSLDLVKISPTAKPPVAKFMDFGKYKFELSKKDKEARKNQKIVNLKEIRFSPTIEDHDLDVKAKNTVKFLQDGDKVKVTIRFRGREVDHAYSVGAKVMAHFIELVTENCVIEKPARLEGKNMSMTLAPKQHS